ncbi:hypothetical protein [Methylobacter sp. YRD-M1]|uniref:hypothetical protein n=1 Tax=Methylobacter sp. YRD-M1 TaxID=2911520 RepID=UPI00227CB99F|nr:hypothetical protein [Methylobacter sp. YRD-M1]WAK03489.1 hypothetical protein LZ558_06840 [Methylobacter sp. YRD-M1]
MTKLQKSKYPVNVLIKLIFISMAILFSNSSFAEVLILQGKEWEIEFDKKTAVQKLAELEQIEQQIAALSEVNPKLATIMTASFLNIKIDKWTKLANYTKQQEAYLASLAVSRLALLAKKIEADNAFHCYSEESRSLMKISQELPHDANTASCRKEAYGSEVIDRLLDREYLMKATDEIKDLPNQWATMAMMYAINMAVVEKFGENKVSDNF